MSTEAAVRDRGGHRGPAARPRPHRRRPARPTRRGGQRPSRAAWPADAWRDLRRNPIFWIAACWSLVLVADGGLSPACSPASTRATCALTPASTAGPSGGAIFGYDVQGCDVYARTIYGARASIMVGAARRPCCAGVIALVLGMLAGFFGGWVDALLSRVTDIFFGIPLLLGGDRAAQAGLSDSRARRGLAAWSSSLGAARLDHRRPGGALLGDHRQAAGLRAGGPGARRRQRPDHAAAHPAERARPGDRRRSPSRSARSSRPRRRCLPRHRPAGPRPSPGASTSTPAATTSATRRTCCSSRRRSWR